MLLACLVVSFGFHEEFPFWGWQPASASGRLISETKACRAAGFRPSALCGGNVSYLIPFVVRKVGANDVGADKATLRIGSVSSARVKKNLFCDSMKIACVHVE
jgi:hypothetical protein